MFLASEGRPKSNMISILMALMISVPASTAVTTAVSSRQGVAPAVPGQHTGGADKPGSRRVPHKQFSAGTEQASGQRRLLQRRLLSVSGE